MRLNKGGNSPNHLFVFITHASLIFTGPWASLRMPRNAVVCLAARPGLSAARGLEESAQVSSFTYNDDRLLKRACSRGSPRQFSDEKCQLACIHDSLRNCADLEGAERQTPRSLASLSLTFPGVSYVPLLLCGQDNDQENISIVPV